MIRNLVCNWLSLPNFTDSLKCAYERIILLEERNKLAWERIVALEQQHSEISKKHAEVLSVLAEIRGLREQLQDTKARVVVARTSSQFRKLMEVDQ